jgi:hypothetical protein
MTGHDDRPVTRPDEAEESELEPGERGTTPMTGATPTETAANIPGGDLYPASPGGDSWDQADDTESSERATGS